MVSRRFGGEKIFLKGFSLMVLVFFVLVLVLMVFFSYFVACLEFFFILQFWLGLMVCVCVSLGCL